MMPSLHVHLSNRDMVAKLHTLPLTDQERDALATAEGDLAVVGHFSMATLRRLRRMLRKYAASKRVKSVVDRPEFAGRTTIARSELPTMSHDVAGAAALDALHAGAARDALSRRPPRPPLRRAG